MRLGKGYLLALFASINQFAFINILAEMKQPTRARVDKLVLISPILPLILFIVIGVCGFISCGNVCPDIILNIDSSLSSNAVMDNLKICLLFCLTIGVIIRNQTIKATLLTLHRQFRESSQNKPRSDDSEQVTNEKLIELYDLREPRISQPLMTDTIAPAQETSEPSLNIRLLLALLSSVPPAILAVLLKKNLLDFVVIGTGFLSPLFIFVFPCAVYLYLGSDKGSQVPLWELKAVKIYVVVATAATYVCLIINTIDTLSHKI